MTNRDSPVPEVTPTLLLRAYAAGVFPMADSAETDEIFWVEPRMRGILPLDQFHLSRSFRKRLQRGGFHVTIDEAFATVVQGCANRPETWINRPIHNLYCSLHKLGHAHSIEVWADDRLIGGLYGVRLGGAFFGESMFSRAPDGSKIALAYLVARLRAGGFALLDTQFTTTHLERLGARTVPKEIYQTLLSEALRLQGDFWALSPAASPASVAQLITQTS